MALPRKTTKIKIVKTGTVVRNTVRRNTPGCTSLHK